MPNPKKKHSPSRSHMRRAANWRVEAPGLATCPQCGAPRLPHHICAACGFYNGELLIPRKEKKKPEETGEKK